MSFCQNWGIWVGNVWIMSMASMYHHLRHTIELHKFQGLKTRILILTFETFAFDWQAAAAHKRTCI